MKVSNICFAQLSPAGIRHLICFIFAMRVKRFPETLTVLTLPPNLKEISSGPKGWHSVYLTSGYTTCYPKLSHLGEWHSKWYWVRVPRDYSLPYNFRVPHRVIKFHKTVSKTQAEWRAIDFFIGNPTAR